MNCKRNYFSRQKKYSLIETFHWEFKDPAFLEIFQERLQKTLEKKFPGQRIHHSRTTSRRNYYKGLERLQRIP